MLSYEDDLVTQQLRQFGAHTRPELAFLLSVVSAGDCVFDLGAHIGTFAIPLAQIVGRSGIVVAVEADDDTYSLLVSNAAANHVDGVVKPVNAILAPTGSRYVAAYEDRNSGATHFVRKSAWMRSRGKLSLGIDEMAVAFRVPDVIKIDIEGLEFDVLESSGVLRRARPVLYAEVSTSQLVRYGSSVDAFDDLLRALSYRLFKNVGDRNAAHDRFRVRELGHLSEGGDFFDVLALPRESSRLSQVLP